MPFPFKSSRKNRQAKYRTLVTEQLEARCLLAGVIHGFHNFSGRENVNGDAIVSPLDVLLVINELNNRALAGGSGLLPDHTDSQSSQVGLDVSCDGYLSPLDALIVINAINAQVFSEGWQFGSEGGYIVPQLSNQVCSPRMVEGDAFVSEISMPFVVPSYQSAIEVNFSDLLFDGSRQGFIRDAFEIAIVDESGRSLVETINTGRDAVFNSTEAIDELVAGGIRRSPGSVLVGLNGIPSGTSGSAIVRLINNDRDELTAVTVDGIHLVQSDVTARPPIQTVTQPRGLFDEQFLTSANSFAVSNSVPGLDLASYQDVTPLYSEVYARTSLNSSQDVLFVDLNAEGQISEGPILVAISNISDPSVRLQNRDGLLSDGTPFFILSDQSRQSGEPIQLHFTNPSRVQFDYELSVLRKPNLSPLITSTPKNIATIGKTYAYDVIATDPEGDALHYSLEQGPVGASIDASTGRVAWRPTNADTGNHNFGITVADSKGATTRQIWSLEAKIAVGNRPPIILSDPKTSVALSPDESLGYSYSIGAFDEDGDLLTYELATAPTGMSIGEDGIVKWLPSANQIGNNDVVIRVSDPNGAFADQSFVVCVHSAQGNHPPTIVSDPIILHYLGANDEYLYEVLAIDPERDQISYQLLDAPTGMTISDAGIIAWQAAIVGVHQVAIQAIDAKGGTDKQLYELEVLAAGNGVISGVKFNDANRNGTQDPDVGVFKLSPGVMPGFSETSYPFFLRDDLKPEDVVRGIVSGAVEYNNGNGANYSGDWNAAGIVVRARGGRLSVGWADPEFTIVSWHQLMIGNSDIGYFALLEPIAENGLGSSNPPETLLVNRTAAEIFGDGFAGLPAGTELRYAILDNPHFDNSGEFVISEAPPVFEPSLEHCEVPLFSVQA